MIEFIKRFLIGVVLSFYFFPIGFTFLPANLNTKMMLAVLGIILLGFDWLSVKKITITKEFLGGFALSLLFSLICFYAADFNHTSDYSYANYWLTFFVWMGGAYAVCSCIRKVHHRVDLPILTFYLAGVCAVQCVLAIVIDRFVPFQLLVDSIVNQGQEFYHEVGRLYGIGASLDPAGVRFAIVLIMISAVLSEDKELRSSRINIILMLLAYFVIAIIGNMISRTTITGLSISILYLIFRTGILQFVIKKEYFKFHLIFGGMLLLVVTISVYLYNTDLNFFKDIRFAFEGFFNFFEHGEFRTNSTDKLNREMWVWPEDLTTWLIGTGIFGSYAFSTDIGYCRFILYTGLIGFSSFALFFVYHTSVFIYFFSKYWLLFVLLLALAFIIWMKVATDIFQIFALFYCLDKIKRLENKQLML